MPECGNNTPDNCGDKIDEYYLNNNIGIIFRGNALLLNV